MVLTEKYQLIKKLARDFSENEITQDLQDEMEETHELPLHFRETIAKSGLLGMKVPKEYGGGGLDTLGYVLAIEEISRVSMVSSIWISGANSLGSGPLLMAGSPEQLEKYLRPITYGKMYPAFGLTEPGAGSDAASLQTTAVQDGEYWILNGRKCFITAAPWADYTIIFARTDPKARSRGITTFIMDMKLPGVSCGKPENKMGILGVPTSDVIMEDVRVHESDMLGELNKGYSYAMNTLDYGRLGVSAQSLGVGQAALDEAIKYSKERKQFGQKISEFQALRFMIADMATELYATRELVYNACVLKDANDPQASMYCSMAKYMSSEMCNHLASKAVQIHGGYGYIKDYKVERLYRDARVNALFEGTSQIQQIVIANNLLR